MTRSLNSTQGYSLTGFPEGNCFDNLRLVDACIPLEAARGGDIMYSGLYSLKTLSKSKSNPEVLQRKESAFVERLVIVRTYIR